MPGYEVSSAGRVRRLAPAGRARVRKPQRHNHGYACVTGRIDGKLRTFLIHRLVAEAFLPPRNGYSCVNHKNGVKTDNRVENLEWCDCTENNRHASRIGLLPVRAVEQLDENGHVIRTFRSIRDAAQATGANPHNISSCCRGYVVRSGYTPKSAGGFLWKKTTTGFIEQLDKASGLVVARFKSCAEAGRATGVNYKNICACVGGYTTKNSRVVETAAGFRWRYMKEGGCHVGS